ncbi:MULTISPECIES: hypothetical protein [unclassified Microbacterium]|uniref:hypothetical protein n=1 Tax=unclassified Microbacterium TaxID=2609290 RepID=UPI001656F93E|nr:MULTISPECIES: hypothetical protein [unclassified Microbacterium]MCT1364654.1 hypothetical protein [Microbacterium sp. p3-SID131]MCT1376843.1 hypothetical protein [Microbacterium sp. p3-SID337]CAD5138170.1 protein of unknown function [Microbacterium sp. Nx66]
MERQSSAGRRAVLTAVVSVIPRPEDLRRNVFVGIDGVDGSGKTVFADEIAELLAPRHPTVAPEAASDRRYVEGQRMYLREDDPERHAAVIVENDDLRAPRIAGPRQ